MTTSSIYRRLECPRCKASAVVDMLARLREAGKLKRDKQPAPEVVIELFSAQAAVLPCEACGHVGLAVQLLDDDADDGNWPTAGRACVRCKAVIPAERLELFPDATLCAACQRRAEQGDDGGPQEYCPRCGGLMKLRQHRGGGIARYVMVCGECGR